MQDGRISYNWMPFQGGGKRYEALAEDLECRSEIPVVFSYGESS